MDARETARALAGSIAESFRCRLSYPVERPIRRRTATDGAVASRHRSLLPSVAMERCCVRRASPTNAIVHCWYNTGRLGFLTELIATIRASRLPALIDRGLSSRSVGTRGGVWRKDFRAQRWLYERATSRIVPFGLSLNGEHIADIPADGICVATPTGSTAYFRPAASHLAAAGPSLVPLFAFFTASSCHRVRR